MRTVLPALALMAAGCTADHANGPPTGRPTIVSLNPCTDAILAELAGPEQLLAISHYSKDPRSSSMPMATAARFRATGGTVEEVLALDPQVVVASDFIAPATRAALTDLGIEVVTFGIASTVAQSEAQVRQLAALAGNPAGGARLVARMEAALDRMGEHDAARPVAVLWQSGGIVAGHLSLVSELVERSGFANYAVMHGMQQADYLPLEVLVARPPDVVLVAGNEPGQRHPVLERLPDMQRAVFDPRLVYCGGPSIIGAADRLAEIRRSLAADASS